MSAWAYYNEIDPSACAVLRELIIDGVICDGEIDERSIRDVCADDVRGFTQCHWFAGGGGWPIAARMSGWPDDLPIWTASLPCQPWSAAGKRRGKDDERDLWTDFYRLADSWRPATIVGEQSASPLGRAWFDQVAADLEAINYAVRACDITALAVDARQIRQRLWFVACANGQSSNRSAKPRDELFPWPSEPAMGCMAHGIAGRMDILRIAGNAVVAPLAAEVIRALMDVSYDANR